MSDIDAAGLNWSDLGVSELVPTGTVTLLLADVEGSTRLWETQPADMTAAFANLDRVLAELVPAHHGVRPIEQGEGDSFVVAFGRASDALACALDLQRAPLAPIRLRIGLHTGEVQLRDESNYIGPTINRTARIRDLAHGGQTVLSGTTADLVLDRVPDEAWLAELGTHPVRDMPRPERVVQLCHPDVRNDFPPLRTARSVRSHNLPAQLTSFVGRADQISEVRRLLLGNRLVTLTGAGGAGKTRLAVEVASQLPDDFTDGVWWVDLAPVADPIVVPVAVARTLRLPDQLGRSPLETVERFVSDRKVLLLLDNCEHLLDISGDVISTLLSACPRLTILSTSREPISVAGEVTWRVPSLSLHDEAITLFIDRAERARPGFRVVGDDAELVAGICRRLDGMPLAIELAAARVRALSLRQISESLSDRFRLLTGGARNALRRQQTLRASVDWSHALLTEPERTLFRRLGVFMGSFDLEAAQNVATTTEAEQFQILDQLSLLVDKSLVIADDASGPMRYRFLETVRQYALEKLSESGEADEVRNRHRDHYVAAASALEREERLVAWADEEIDNLRAAHTWSLEKADFEKALRLVSSLYRFWTIRGRMIEGIAGAQMVFDDERYRDDDVPPAVWITAVACMSTLTGWIGTQASLERACEALDAARELGDDALTALCLGACGAVAYYIPNVGLAYLEEAVELSRTAGDKALLCDIRSYQAFACHAMGLPAASLAAAEEGRDLAEALGYGFMSRHCRIWLGVAAGFLDDISGGLALLNAVVDDTQGAGEHMLTLIAIIIRSQYEVAMGDVEKANETLKSAFARSASMGGVHEDSVHAARACIAVMAGNAVESRDACEAAVRTAASQRVPFVKCNLPMSEALVNLGDLVAARRWIDEVVSYAPNAYQMYAFMVRAVVAFAQGETDQSEVDAHTALTISTRTKSQFRVGLAFDCLGLVSAADESNHERATRLLAAAAGIRARTSEPRYVLVQECGVAVDNLRKALGEAEFDAAWAEGMALSTEEAIAYAQRGRGERKRPTSGWNSLTPTEADVVKLVAEGLGNKDIAERLFISPRTVQTHLTHVYAKLGLTSRIQLIQEAGRHV